MLTEKAEGRIAMLIVDKLAFQEKLSEGEKTLAAYILAQTSLPTGRPMRFA